MVLTRPTNTHTPHQHTHTHTPPLHTPPIHTHKHTHTYRTPAGKSCLVSTALGGVPGVVSVQVPAGMPDTDIEATAIRAVTGITMPTTYDFTASAARLTRWHRRLFAVPPTVVLEVKAREGGDRYAKVAAACRTLAGIHGWRVVVDASYNSLPDFLRTKRERILQVEHMPRALIERMSGLAPLHAALRGAGLADAVWAALGGSPADYHELDVAWHECGDIKSAANTCVQHALGTAAADWAATRHHFAPVYDMFGTMDMAPGSAYTDQGMVRPSPDRVLRRTWRDDKGYVLVPVTPAMAIVLRYQLAGTLHIDALVAMLAAGGAAPTPSLAPPAPPHLA